jgi:hypothetical protein
MPGPFFERSCFVVSPFGVSDEERSRYQHLLDNLIKPAVDSANLGLLVVRGDEIPGPGSFVRDVLGYLAHAYVVIADLSAPNANVFYELGVRHALTPRTILMADRMEAIPSDLREYRAVVYGSSSPEQVKLRLVESLRDIAAHPDQPDNPVWGHLRIPNLPEDLRQTFIARRIGAGDTQALILRYIEKAAISNRKKSAATAVTERELRKRFSMGGTELYYRLEQLRLLGFLEKTSLAPEHGFTYDVSSAYWREISPDSGAH